MQDPIDIRVDVTEAAGMPAQLAATAFLPEPDRLSSPPIVCFAVPGGGYGRGYYSFDMPGSSGRGQAGWHTARGWIFVAVDHLGVGESSTPDAPLSFETVAAANHAAVEHVVERLRSGTLVDGLAALGDLTTLGLGQSMGGCYTIVLQAHHRTFDGIGVLGFSGIHTIVPTRPGTPAWPVPWLARGSSPGAPTVLNPDAVAAGAGQVGGVVAAPETVAGEHPFAWAFHYDDVPDAVVAADMGATAGGGDPLPPWRSATTPSSVALMLAPGVVASEVASITAPVLVAVGERDVVPDPWSEPFAFRSSTDVTVYVCPRMAHMHNFASTREQFWRRIHHWGEGVALMRTDGA